MSVTESQEQTEPTKASSAPASSQITPLSYGVDKTEFLAASNAAYGLSEGTFKAPEGMVIIDKAFKPEDGFAAVALRDRNGNILIANEGTVPPGEHDILNPDPSSVFKRGTVAADLEIYKGETPKALKDAAAFAKQVEGETSGKIFVTGHSLGGIEAEQEAKFMDHQSADPSKSRLAGGMTFGATGLPNNKETSDKMTNIVDYGDMVGNFSSAPSSPLKKLVPEGKDMLYYGHEVMEGNPADAAKLEHLASQKLASDQAAPWMSWSPADIGDRAGKFIAAGSDAKDSVTESHVIKNYGKDVQIDPGAAPVNPYRNDDLIRNDDLANAIAAHGAAIKNAGAVVAQLPDNANNGLASPTAGMPDISGQNLPAGRAA